MESDKEKSEKPKNPRASANILSALLFGWTIPIFIEGTKRDFEEKDLFEPLKEHSSSYVGDQLEKLWNKEVTETTKKKKVPSLLKVISKFVALQIIGLGLLIFLVEIVLRIAQPLFLARLIDYFSPGSTTTKDDAYLYALGVVACSGIPVLIVHPYMMGITHLGMKLRVAACSLIYRKALRLSKTALGQTTVGQIVNLLSNDVNRFDVAFIFLHNLWIGPLQAIIITYILWQFIGVSTLFGIGTLLVFIPFQGWVGKKASELRLKTAGKTDERVRLMNEIISGIQVIKMYTWEKPFIELVSTARRKEINVIRIASYMKGVLASFIIFHTRTAIFCTILAYVMSGNVINAQKVFMVISYFNTLRQTMTVFFPIGVAQTAEATVSINRIKEFLLRDETKKPLRPQVINTGLNSDKPVLIDGVDTGSIMVDSATAKWTPDLIENTLNKVDLKIKPGSLTAVIGPVGSGKTSLLHALLEELPLSEGRIQLSGSISYASQEPWLFAGSVRQNILFGELYDRERYRQVVKVCSLRTDFQQFPYGDKTIVGERGVSLSGGQRARINLARAIYKKADIYLLDDPLSAVDAHVSKHLFEDCISGFLRNSTVVLVTHQVQFLNSVDKVVLLESGAVKREGTYQELNQSGEEFLKMFRNLEEEEEDNEEKLLGRGMFRRQSSVQSVASSIEEGLGQPVEVEETRTRGRVGGKVYKTYLVSGGGCLFVFVTFIMAFLAQFIASFGDYWVTFWVNLEERVFPAARNSTEPFKINYDYEDDQIVLDNYGESLNSTASTLAVSSEPAPFNLDRELCIYIFGGITLMTIIIVITRSFMFFSMCMRSSIKLHNGMFSSIIRAPMRFFNTNTSGRILNRFSKDMGSVDELLPAALIDCLQIGLSLLAIITVVAIMNFWLLIPTFLAAFIFYFLRKLYLCTSRNVKRLEGVTRSPVFAHLNASIQGLTTIRAFGAEEVLRREFDHHQDLHSTAWYLFLATSRAFGFWLDSVCLLYIFLVTMSFLFLDKETFGGNVGLAITQSIGLTGMFQWGMRQSAEVENQMTSVERVLEYSNLDSEPPLEIEEKKPKPGWPEYGKIVFEKVFLRYSETEPWVLKNLNFTILPQQKVGIVGRTGAGKSSLISALFRLTPVDGAIFVDDVDVLQIGLHELRSKIAIIPQEPVLFSGTLRKNLDPFDQYTDESLWYALEQVELKDFVSDLPGKLSSKVSEGGTNLSVGQRQLVCLARAILRSNKILVLDEATANVDPQTDALIQKTIREKFDQCTVLTIAHRLHTVMDSDKVLVMDGGCVEEFDHPHLLLQNKEGFLSKMVQQTGKTTAEALRQVAKKNFEEIPGGLQMDDIPLIDEDVPSNYGES